MTKSVPRPRRPAWAALAAAAALLPIAASACGDDPFSFDWDHVPDTVVLYSMAREEPNLPTGFSFFTGAVVRIEAPNAVGTWDVALDTRDGGLVLLPPGALGVESRARIAALEGLALEDLREAPSDTSVYEATEPVPVTPGTIYVVRTHQRLGSFGTRCVYYAKAEAVDIDVEGGRLTFRYIENPVCNDRNLVPPE